ncbi:probable beta-glucosidase [Cephalotrichum gorgonifer]|uniref:Beta-glucosidase cel3A n=1 Tax=Cephalotrichum gorgonifer TaxID=2041049 RepID=A0AAE8MUW2_9PEZI|nr:probable beta-glucosidase [Cephalotrichum gorgonifer]
MKGSLVSALAALVAVGDVAVATPMTPRDDALAYSPPHYPSPWMNPAAEDIKYAYDRARAFVSGLTLPEKVNLTTGVGWMGERCVGNTGSIPRLGMRGLCLQDGPVGIRFGDYNSVFPAGQLSAATWDRVLINKRARAMGEEAKGKGIDILLAPVAGPIGRIPAGGRNWEGFSPDPYLTGVGMAESARGIRSAGVIATAKHFVGNEQEHFRQAGEAQGQGFDIDESMSSNIDDKTMHELYMWPFADAVYAGVGAVMCSYQQVNNSYGCQNSKLLNGLLKDELGFQGFVMSDWQAQHTGVASAAAGLDMTMPGDTTFNSGDSFWGANLTLAVLNGTVPAWRLDDMALRIMTTVFNTGLEPPLPEINFSSWTLDTVGPIHASVGENVEVINQHVNVQSDHAPLIREVAAKGTVLLKNEGGVLPLNKPKFLAVIGEDAGPNPRGPNGCPDRGCDDGTLAMAWGSGTSNFPYLVTPDQALQAQALEDGTRYESILSNYQNAATRALVRQDNATTIVFVNADSGEGYIAVDENLGDRKNLTLWKGGDELIKNVTSECANTIVVIHSTGPVLLTEWYDNPNVTAILWAGVPGQESGNSITDVLYGRVSPGRTPFTWGRTLESYGTAILDKPNNGGGAPQDDFSEGVFIDYRHFDRATARNPDDADAAPIYEFGFGLSYTTFEYSDLQISGGAVREYTPTEGETIEAPVLSEDVSTDPADYQFPTDIRPIEQFLYPFLNSTDPEKASRDPKYGQTAEEFLPPGATDGSPQPLLRSSGQPGGNPQLWEVLFTVSVTITNTGDVEGDEVPQVYVSLGGDDEPVRVLRGFGRVTVPPGESVVFKTDLTRRDLSGWDVEVQDWVINEHEKTVWVGSSSRNLPLSATLEFDEGTYE